MTHFSFIVFGDTEYAFLGIHDFLNYKKQEYGEVSQ